MLYTYFSRNDFIEFTLSLSESLAITLLVTKFVAFFTYNTSIKRTLDNLEQMWKEANKNGNKTWRDIDREHQRKGERNTKIVVGIFLSTAIIYMVVPFVIFLFKALVLKNPGDTFTLGTHVEYV